MPSLLNGLALGLRFGLSIVGPLLLGVLGGRLLDQRLDTTPWFLLVGVGVASLCAAILITRQVHDLDRPA